jgi:hypothetical protein
LCRLFAALFAVLVALRFSFVQKLSREIGTEWGIIIILGIIIIVLLPCGIIIIVLLPFGIIIIVLLLLPLGIIITLCITKEATPVEAAEK